MPDAREQRVVGRAVVEVLQGVRRNKRFRGTSADAITTDAKQSAHTHTSLQITGVAVGDARQAVVAYKMAAEELATIIGSRSAATGVVGQSEASTPSD